MNDMPFKWKWLYMVVWEWYTEQCPGMNIYFAHLTLMLPATPLDFSSVGNTLNIHDSGPLSQASGNP